MAHARREANDHSLQLSRMHAFCDDRHGPLEVQLRGALESNREFVRSFKEKDLELAALKKRLAELDRA